MPCCKTPVQMKLKKVEPSAKTPTRGTPGSSGWDLYTTEYAILAPGERRILSTGWNMQVPMGYEIQIRPRSGLAAKQGITVLNAPGTVDSDFTGVVKVILLNTSDQEVTFYHGDRIAQAVVAEVPMVELVEVSELDSTERGEGGFGSTGR